MPASKQFMQFDRNQAKLVTVPEFVPAIRSKFGYKWCDPSLSSPLRLLVNECIIDLSLSVYRCTVCPKLPKQQLLGWEFAGH